MSSKSSEENTDKILKDIGTILDRYDRLRKKHNDLAMKTAQGLEVSAQLGESLVKEIKKRDRKIFWLSLSQIAVLVYLIIVL